MPRPENANQTNCSFLVSPTHCKTQRSFLGALEAPNLANATPQAFSERAPRSMTLQANSWLTFMFCSCLLHELVMWNTRLVKQQLRREHLPETAGVEHKLQARMPQGPHSDVHMLSLISLGDGITQPLLKVASSSRSLVRALLRVRAVWMLLRWRTRMIQSGKRRLCSTTSFSSTDQDNEVIEGNTDGAELPTTQPPSPSSSQ
ncbi:hypothetical protein DFH29DRAFT_304076 [Suillus ampliporus]|nr:hypothetical protein DFH29DRAFT_304076 [Suillus ampliporus]